MAITTTQAAIVADLKAGRPTPLALSVQTRSGETVGSALPITHAHADDSAVTDALYRWRRAHMTAFLTVFEPTPEKTRNYLTSFSLPDPARLLFLISDRNGKPVGHSGFCNIAADGAEIDNVIRGEAVERSDFMLLAHRAILRWAFEALDIPRVYLNVLAHNARAIRSYEKTGLVATGETPLARQEMDGGYRLVPATADDAAPAAFLLRMELSRAAFMAQPRHAAA